VFRDRGPPAGPRDARGGGLGVGPPGPDRTVLPAPVRAELNATEYLNNDLKGGVNEPVCRTPRVSCGPTCSGSLNKVAVAAGARAELLQAPLYALRHGRITCEPITAEVIAFKTRGRIGVLAELERLTPISETANRSKAARPPNDLASLESLRPVPRLAFRRIRRPAAGAIGAVLVCAVRAGHARRPELTDPQVQRSN